MMMRRGARRTARRTSRRVARRTMRRRMVVGGMVVLAATGTAAAIKMSKKDVERIEQHTGLPPEQLEDEDLHQAMQELGIKGEPLTAEDQAALADAPAGTPAAAKPAVQAPAAAPQESYMQELEKLAELHERGILTDEEFAAKKKQLLGL